MTKITFHGGARSVTGANHLIDTGKTKVLVDCGLMQGGKHAEDQNYAPFAYNPADIKAVFLTHAHVDHSGRLPKLFKDGFRGGVYATHPTKDLIGIMLEDSQGLIANEAEREGREPLYLQEDVAAIMERVEGVEYGEELRVSDDMRVRFRDAGHILGSAIIEVWVREGNDEKKIVFSGDLGNPPAPLLKPTEFIDEADYAVVESVYGDRLHEDREARKNLLEDAIEDTFAKGGTLLIPSFAVERAQELLYEMNGLVENKRIPSVPIFIDSPMAIAAIDVYKKYPQYYNQETTYLMKSGDQIFQFPRLTLTRSAEESKRINEVPPPKVIIAGAGMSTGGRILHHERRYLPDPKNMILIIGFQSAGTLGRRIFDGAQEVMIFGEQVPVRARVKAIGGYSAHADQKGLYKWVEHIRGGGKLKKVFVVQGEETPALALSQLFRDNMGVDAHAPMLGEEFVL